MGVPYAKLRKLRSLLVTAAGGRVQGRSAYISYRLTHEREQDPVSSTMAEIIGDWRTTVHSTRLTCGDELLE